MRKTGARGFTLVEVVLAASILVIAVMGLFASITSSMQASALARERATALRAASRQLEALKAMTTNAAFATVTSRCFVVAIDANGKSARLLPQAGDPDGIVGFIWFPGDDSTRVSADEARRSAAKRALQFPAPPGTPTDPKSQTLGDLREDVTYLPLALPKDLDADGTINASDVSGTASVLPVVVGVEWRGVAGNQQVVIQSTLRK